MYEDALRALFQGSPISESPLDRLAKLPFDERLDILNKIASKGNIGPYMEGRMMNNLLKNTSVGGTPPSGDPNLESWGGGYARLPGIAEDVGAAGAAAGGAAAGFSVSPLLVLAALIAAGIGLHNMGSKTPEQEYAWKQAYQDPFKFMKSHLFPRQPSEDENLRNLEKEHYERAQNIWEPEMVKRLIERHWLTSPESFNPPSSYPSDSLSKKMDFGAK